MVLLKPDAVSRGLCGEVIRRFEQRGLIIAGMKMLKVSPQQAKRHYQEHVGKPFYPDLIDYITSGPVVALAVKGNQAVKVLRTMMGATNPVDALPGTIRGDFATQMENNIIHGSDSLNNATRELDIFFSKEEIYE
ncbi:nucleoside diphosphate kinase [Methylomusa anaerophila]|uniref:Nucleoside diphosphate kinase n=1 Tax=Methylomusa anaerophila TaxID=1930071 RepID=A0A348APJ4_9FIRM|nr:nucleoside diphosphate kinase [Methylomusa anaerophila]